MTPTLLKLHIDNKEFKFLATLFSDLLHNHRAARFSHGLCEAHQRRCRPCARYQHKGSSAHFERDDEMLQTDELMR